MCALRAHSAPMLCKAFCVLQQARRIGFMFDVQPGQEALVVVVATLPSIPVVNRRIVMSK